jgi:DNA-binding transcriptional MerR regulator
MSESTELTIDALASRAGMTVRNVRAHQSRGLLQPPEIRGRTGYYGPEHLARLELIQDLQAEGLTLETIGRILENAPAASAAEVLDFTRAVTAPFSEERPQVAEGADLAAPWGGRIEPELTRRVEQLGFLRPLGDGRFEVRSPRLLRASEELADLGVPLDTAIELTSLLRRQSEAIAKAYVELFLEHVWRPFERRGDSPPDWSRVREALDRLRPLATQSFVAVFQMVMTDKTEEALDRELKRLGKADRRPDGVAGDGGGDAEPAPPGA